MVGEAAEVEVDAEVTVQELVTRVAAAVTPDTSAGAVHRETTERLERAEPQAEAGSEGGAAGARRASARAARETSICEQARGTERVEGGPSTKSSGKHSVGQ